MRVNLPIPRDAAYGVQDLAQETERAFDRVPDPSENGPLTYKSDIIDRMSEEEVEMFDQTLDVVSARFRQKWYAIQAVYHQAAEYADFQQQMSAIFGADRTAIILETSRVR